MRRQGQFTDSGVNPLMQQKNLYQPQQMSGNAYSAQDPMRPADAHYSGASWPPEGQWHRDRDSGKDPNNFLFTLLDTLKASSTVVSAG